MEEKRRIGNGALRIIRGDITDLDLESFVFYARNDLELGSGFGTAVSMRGGPGIQKALKELAPLETTKAVVTEAGELKAKYIVHAVGPRFQEDELEAKLAATIRNALAVAEEKGIKAIAFPPMGTGFYGVPLDTCADIMISEITAFLENGSTLEDVAICLMDTREQQPFTARLSAVPA